MGSAFVLTFFVKFHVQLALVNSTTIESLDNTSQQSLYSIGFEGNLE
jgi:hypothetical protein